MYYSYKRMDPSVQDIDNIKQIAIVVGYMVMVVMLNLNLPCDERDDKGWVYDFGNLKMV